MTEILHSERPRHPPPGARVGDSVSASSSVCALTSDSSPRRPPPAPQLQKCLQEAGGSEGFPQKWAWWAPRLHKA